MITIVRLQDGCYKVTVCLDNGETVIHQEYVFSSICESSADIEQTLLTIEVKGW